MIYTVTIVETNHVFPEIQTTPYATIDKAIAEIDKIIYERELWHDAIQKQLAEMREYECGTLNFEEDDFYIDLDCFCSAY